MPKETSTKKFSLKNIENADVAKVVAGTSIGVVTPFILREYVDNYAPEGVWPGVIPIEWGRPSVIGSIALGVSCLIGGVVSKSLRLFLLPLGIASTSVGVMMGLFPTPPSSAVRLVVPAGQGRLLPGQQKQRAPGLPGNITLKSAGNIPLKSASPGGSNFIQKNPEQRLAQLEKESSDIELQSQIEKLEEENKFKKSQPSSAIPLRT